MTVALCMALLLNIGCFYGWNASQGRVFCLLSLFLADLGALIIDAFTMLP
ncbi:MAG: hypothetical protein QS748_09780 [Candidatus Endonucleobacter bathymodioli]|uniref:Uncharacterized protein n=1 Tax=Candidatus Endonucleibacter bathymodioli TaxID=539814 RepID=A0AA90NMG3_9GAMM|nr:hypothetical protein [Candidatus Endonucleobacter bathymodioli]